MEYVSIISDVVSALATVVAAGFVIGIFLYNKKQQQFDFLEQSFDVLQRINEKALESPEHSLAAVLSGNPNDKTTKEDAFIVYFHYMRINRIFRAFEYCNGGFITKEQRDRICSPAIPTLVPILDKLPAILERGYPAGDSTNSFAEFLIPLVREANVPRRITG